MKLFNKIIANTIEVSRKKPICRKLLKTTRRPIYRKNKNLIHIVLKGKSTEATLQSNSTNFILKKYNAKKSSWCKNLVNTATFKSTKHRKNEAFQIKHTITCNYDWVIYLVNATSTKSKMLVGVIQNFTQIQQ